MSFRSLFALALCALGTLAIPAVHAQDPRFGGGPGYGPGGGQVVECRSSNYAYQRCPVPWRDAQLVRQLSSSQCIRGRTWGIDRGGLWVDRGCGAQFVEAGGWSPPRDWNRRFDLTCSSSGYNYQFCAVDLGGGGRAILRRQTSNSACIEGRTWGWNRAGIWVNQGCGGVFTIDRRWR